MNRDIKKRINGNDSNGQDEVPAYRKRPKSASVSASDRRSDQKHEYERVILATDLASNQYYWAKRCLICGRVDDSGMFKPSSSDDFVRCIREFRTKPDTNLIRVFYSLHEIRARYPGVAILKYDYKKKEYKEIYGGDHLWKNSGHPLQG